MPRAKSKVSQAVLDAKGTMSQKEASDKFGVSVATVSRAWKDQPRTLSEDSKINKFDVEHNDPGKAEHITINVDDGEFLDTFEDTMNKFQEEAVRPPDDPMKLEFKSGADISRELDMMGIGPEGVSKTSAILTQDDLLLEEANKFISGEGVEESKSSEKKSKRKVDDIIDNVLPKLESEVKPSKKKQKMTSMDNLTIPKVKMDPPRQEHSIHMLIARINSYVRGHKRDLVTYIGEDEKSEKTFLKSLAKKKVGELNDIYLGMRSIVNFSQTTETCRNGAVMIAGFTEAMTCKMGLKTEGTMLEVANNPNLNEICEDYVMLHHDKFSLVDRPEIRFASLLMQTASKRRVVNVTREQFEASMKEDEVMHDNEVKEEEGVEENKIEEL